METITIGKWNIPKNLFDEYIKWTIHANGYLDKSRETPSDGLPSEDYERTQRWLLCSSKVMETHRKICEAIGIEYSEDIDDEFYKAFHKAVSEQTRLRG